MTDADLLTIIRAIDAESRAITPYGFLPCWNNPEAEARLVAVARAAMDAVTPEAKR